MGCGTHQAMIAYAMSRKHLSRVALLPLMGAAHTSSWILFLLTAALGSQLFALILSLLRQYSGNYRQHSRPIR